MFGESGNTIDRHAALSGVQWRSGVRGRALSSARGRFVGRLVGAICLLVALAEPVASAIDKPPDYVGATVCAPCHREIFEHWSQTGHAGGPGARHAVSQRREDIVTRSESCPSRHRQK